VLWSQAKEARLIPIIHPFVDSVSQCLFILQTLVHLVKNFSGMAVILETFGEFLKITIP
jgi:hypothetical protein